jgi:hypothetical protein
MNRRHGCVRAAPVPLPRRDQPLAEHKQFPNSEKRSKNRLVASGQPERQVDVEVIRALLCIASGQTRQRTTAPVDGEDRALDQNQFLGVIRAIREKLLELGACPRSAYECGLMQGSGTFAIESVISSDIPSDGKLLVLGNGAYGRRIAQMARIHAIPVEVAEVAEDRKITAALAAERPAGGGFTHVAAQVIEYKGKDEFGRRRETRPKPSLSFKWWASLGQIPRT